MDTSIQEAVKDYYGKTLQSSQDLKTDACCTVDDIPDHLKSLIAKIHPEVASRYYGCGLVVPEEMLGLRVLDLGCGSGQDCYLLSALVGENGSVVGVDMTEQQLAVANTHIDYHRKQFGYTKSNVAFCLGELEHLERLPLEDNSFDLIVSNCVINLCPDKAAVLAGAFRLLKPGGELYFSDVYADRRVPQALVSDPELYGECLSGALYWQDFLNLARGAGFADPRLVSDRPLAINSESIKNRLDGIHFYSAVYRLFKIPELEQSAEDYGQSVIYKGTIEHHGCNWQLDKQHKFAKGKPVAVSGNTFRLLGNSRYAQHFELLGDFSRHRGGFTIDGDTGIPFSRKKSATGGCCG